MKIAGVVVKNNSTNIATNFQSACERCSFPCFSSSLDKISHFRIYIFSKVLKQLLFTLQNWLRIANWLYLMFLSPNRLWYCNNYSERLIRNRELIYIAHQIVSVEGARARCPGSSLRAKRAEASGGTDGRRSPLQIHYSYFTENIIIVWNQWWISIQFEEYKAFFVILISNNEWLVVR